MNRYQNRINYQNFLFLVTLFGTTTIGNGGAYAQSRPEIESNLPISRPVQVAQASDTAGNWAEPFIKVLVEKGIISGYPDGTFRPDQPVTRAEFAALLAKAFDLEPVKAARTFKDVSGKFWAAPAISKAYQAGFLAGYPNNTFAPGQNIIRIESLVAISNGSKLQADASAPKIDELFTDSAQIPSFGRDAVIAATQKCVTVSVSYPEGKTFNPQSPATRADVAAFIHQALVATGKLSALPGDSPAQKYIVNCGATTTPVANITEKDVIDRIGVGSVPSVETGVATVVKTSTNRPVAGITTPSAFGANWGTFFIGSGFQESLSPVSLLGPNGFNTTSLGLAAGFGLGDSRDLIGLETAYSTSSNNGGPANGASSLGLFSRGSVNFKLHKQFGDNFAVAAGWENAIRNGYAATDSTYRDTFYGVLTSVLPVSDSNNFTASVGVGNGRFRSINDIFVTGRDTTSVFGSLGFRVSENIGLVADYNGRNFSLGLPLSLKLSDGMGLQVTPALLDVAGDKVAGELTRFGIGGGLGIRF
jgi:hypothetical protein